MIVVIYKYFVIKKLKSHMCKRLRLVNGCRAVFVYHKSQTQILPNSFVLKGMSHFSSLHPPGVATRDFCPWPKLSCIVRAMLYWILKHPSYRKKKKTKTLSCLVLRLESALGPAVFYLHFAAWGVARRQAVLLCSKTCYASGAPCSRFSV